MMVFYLLSLQGTRLILTSVGFLYSATSNSFPVFDFSEHIKKENKTRSVWSIWGWEFVCLFPLEKKLNRRKRWSYIKERQAGEKKPKELPEGIL